jgi:vacuolar protein sorting-associated protein 1
MSSSAVTWSCDISLRIDYDADGNLIDLKSKPTVPFSPHITDKKDVEIWLRRAQAAILSPHVSFSQFLSKDIEALRDLATSDPQSLPFSKNVVVVDIKDPDAVDLSFVDLPGMITISPSGWYQSQN